MNKNCIFNEECGRVCSFAGKERDCDYYHNNISPGYGIDSSQADTDNIDFEEDKAELVYIPIENLYPHPDNPRKELGDLTELADSIRAKGIMQNLTVVPFVSKYNPKVKRPNDYTVVIGHRRLGASKLAGLTELPCVISDMSPKEQLATMIAENMQRSDLTVYEEACGMQMLLDLGDTVESVSAQTGLSSTTVRRRVKLLEMDRDKVKKSLERGATLEDFEKLGKIKDEIVRNQLLNSIGTSNFNWEYKQALERMKKAEKKAVVLKKLNRFASSLDDIKGLVFVSYFSYAGDPDNIKIPEDVGRVKYFYYAMNGCAELYREKTEKDKAEEIEKAEEKRRNTELRDKFADIEKRAYVLRRDFMRRAYIADREQLAAVMRFAVWAYISGESWKSVTDSAFCNAAGLGGRFG